MLPARDRSSRWATMLSAIQTRTLASADRETVEGTVAALLRELAPGELIEVTDIRFRMASGGDDAAFVCTIVYRFALDPLGTEAALPLPDRPPVAAATALAARRLS